MLKLKLKIEKILPLFFLTGAIGYDRLQKINGLSSVPFAIASDDRLAKGDYMGS